MHVNDDSLRQPPTRMRFENSLNRAKRVIKSPLHKDLAQRLRHQNFASTSGIKQTVAPPGRPLGKVQGPDDTRLFFDVLQHVFLVKGVIAQSQTVSSGIEQQLGMCPTEPHAIGGIFAIDHDKVEPPLLTQPRQVFGDGAAPSAAHHIA